MVTLVYLTLAGCNSSSPDPEQVSTAEPNSVASGNAPQLICRYEKETGSHQKRKICRTQAQLDEEQEKARETLRRVQGNSSATSVGS